MIKRRIAVKLNAIITTSFWIGALTGFVGGAALGIVFMTVFYPSAEDGKLQVQHHSPLHQSTEKIVRKPVQAHAQQLLKPSEKNTHKKKASPPAQPPSQNEDSAFSDTLAMNPHDTLAQHERIIQTDSFTLPEKETLAGGEMILIKRDKLLAGYQVYCILMEESDNETEDSTYSDKKEQKTGKLFTVEFWQSPINYKGYKMANGKVVLFGLPPDPNIKLCLLDGTYYLGSNGMYYAVSYTYEYKPLIPLSDEAIIEQLIR